MATNINEFTSSVPDTILVENTGTVTNIILEFYLNSAYEALPNSFGSIEVKVEFPFCDGSYIGSIGDTNKNNGILEIGAISANNYTNFTRPIFTLNMTDLEINGAFILKISDIVIDGEKLNDTSSIIA